MFGTGGLSPCFVGDLAGVPSLRGEHNRQNALAALTVGTIIDPDPPWEDHLAALRTFPGLPHRMEEVGRLGRAIFVNDSKATNADSTEKALTAFRDIHWILGGKAKEGGIFPLVPLFDRIAHAYLIGAASDAFAATLQGAVPFTRCETLDVATRAAAEGAAASGASEPVVLLSPACASYDQFRSFEDRGDQFRDLVRALP
jgi:UDP-N-acetylmuramoylalanine--D-glutamate ligase